MLGVRFRLAYTFPHPLLCGGMALAPDDLRKLRLLSDGVRIDPLASDHWHEIFDGPITLAEYATTGGVALVLPGERYVNAPIVSTDEVMVLSVVDDRFVLIDGTDVIGVDTVPVPAFHRHMQHDAIDQSIQPSTNYGVTHTDRCRVSPISGCAWRCEFCDLPYEFTYRKRHKDNMLATIAVAARDELAPARHVLISGGTPRAPVTARPGREARDDEAWLDDVFEHLARHSPLPVDVMMAPRRDMGHPEWLRGVGVASLSLNLEVSDEARARAIAPAKAKLGRRRTLDYIEHAVEAFGVGCVQSLVVFGKAIEPLDSTLTGVRDLADRGCIPVLSPFRPHRLTPLRDAPAATYEETVDVYVAALDICAAAGTGVKLGPRCVPCHHNTATLPDGSDFYFGAAEPFPQRPPCIS